MYCAIAPSSTLSSVPRQSKVDLQRSYRQKEGKSFNALRDVINELTGEELQTRQEILRKATDLLSAASKVRKLREAQVVHLMPNEENMFTAEHDAVTGHVGHSAPPSSSGLQNWYNCAEFDSQPAYWASQSQSHDQHHHMLFTTDSAMNPTSPRGHADYRSDYQY